MEPKTNDQPADDVPRYPHCTCPNWGSCLHPSGIPCSKDDGGIPDDKQGDPMTPDTPERETQTLEQLVRSLQAHANEHGWQDVDDPIAALLEWRPSSPDPQWVIDNIYTIARRESGRSLDRLRPEMWGHVLRLCEKVNARTRTVGVLRDVTGSVEGSHPTTASADGAESTAALTNPDPRCPRCGYTMCQLFDERRITALATEATPNGRYQCYHCTPLSSASSSGASTPEQGKATCSTHGHIYGAAGVCLFCRELKPQDASPRFTHDDACLLSRIFNAHSDLVQIDQYNRINEFLKRTIAEAK